MTGTADTEAAEFHQIYTLDVVVMPPNRFLIRIENPDVVYRTEREKFHAAVEEIKELHAAGRPVLVGTISIEKSEVLSTYLKRQGVPHNVLNAKNHEREAEIVAQAGRKGAVTISTNMAGRGTDILLGGNPEFLARKACKLGSDDPNYAAQLEKAQAQCAAEHDEVVALGGLHILGTERHEARRIDNQLRGRAGRQGDPGSSRFYLSLEDDLLRIFGSERISGMMAKLGMEEGQPIEHSMITKAIENAQRKVEGHNFDIRKHLLEYDDVMNKQREVIYAQRREALESEEIDVLVRDIHHEVLDELFDTYIPEDAYADDWDLTGLTEGLHQQYGVSIPLTSEHVASFSREALLDHVRGELDQAYAAKGQTVGQEQFQGLERWVTLQVIDKHWKDHLLAMDHLKEGIGLRGYGQKNPLNEYKREGYELFLDMTDRIKADITEYLFKAQVTNSADTTTPQPRRQQRAVAHRGTLPGMQEQGERDGGTVTTVRRQGEKVGRNAPCPCGSGKKYKKCCGAA
jgi:preprotein translocase subunit SecA